MNFILAKKMEELEFDELLEVLRKFEMEEPDAFSLLQEFVEDI